MNRNGNVYDCKIGFALSPKQEEVKAKYREYVEGLLEICGIKKKSGCDTFIREIVIDLIVAKYLTTAERLLLLLKCYILVNVPEMHGRNSIKNNFMLNCYVDRLITMKIDEKNTDSDANTMLVATETIKIVNSKRATTNTSPQHTSYYTA